VLSLMTVAFLILCWPTLAGPDENVPVPGTASGRIRPGHDKAGAGTPGWFPGTVVPAGRQLTNAG
jgi:hypothetical protein